MAPISDFFEHSTTRGGGSFIRNRSEFCSCDLATTRLIPLWAPGDASHFKIPKRFIVDTKPVAIYVFFFFGKSESRSIYWSISIVPSGFCCGYHQCFFWEVYLNSIAAEPAGWNPWDSEKKNECRIDASQNLTHHKKVYLYRFIDEAATEWTNGISQMCPELLSNGLFHSARKKKYSSCTVVMFFTAVFPSPTRWTLQTSSGLLPSWR